jgi:hypothetical protein
MALCLITERPGDLHGKEGVRGFESPVGLPKNRIAKRFFASPKDWGNFFWLSGASQKQCRKGLNSLAAHTDPRVLAGGRGGPPPHTLVVLFGSVARGEATPDSDLDLLVVRPAECEPDEPVWQEQLSKLQTHASAWTGNDARVLEFGEHELAGGEPQQVLMDAARDGIELYGTLRMLRRGSRAHTAR